MTRWSVIIPAFNEETRLSGYLLEVVDYLEARGESYEVVVVDDGSTDDTAAVVWRIARERPVVRLIRFSSNLGKGAAVRAGMLDSHGELRLFADADGATPIAELARLERALHVGADIAIASRGIPDPTVSVQARLHRKWAGFVFRCLTASVGLAGIIDSQCGFKCFRGSVADDLFRAVRTDGFAFDVEVLMLAQQRGYRIAEVAVNWTDRAHGKVRVLKHGPGMAWQILKARRRVLRE